MENFEALLSRLEELMSEIATLEEVGKDLLFELLDGIDTIHRIPLAHLADHLGTREVERLRDADSAVAWLFDAYGLGVDERQQAEDALKPILPYIHSHGGRIDVLEVSAGIVRARMSGSCAGCTASAVTLKEGVEQALRDGFPGYVGLEVEEEQAPEHPPPGPTLLQIGKRQSKV